MVQKEAVFVLEDQLVLAAVEGIYSDLVALVDLVGNAGLAGRRIQVEDHKEDSQGQDRKRQGVDHILYQIALEVEEGRNHHIDQEEDSFVVEGKVIRRDVGEDLVKSFEVVPERVRKEDLGAVEEDRDERSSEDLMSVLATKIPR